MAKDYYKTLGVDKNASADDIKNAYRRMAKKYHPDINKEADASERFKEVNEAYEVLSDSNKKSNYDNYGSAEGPSGFGGAGGFGGGGFNFNGFDDLFNMFGGGFGGGASRKSAGQNGSDIEVKVGLSFEEAVFGCEKEVPVSRVDSCEKCSGTGAKGGTKYTTCSQCNGQGTISYAENTFLGRVVRQGVCKDCNGTGKKIIEKCDACNGNGYNHVSKNVKIKVPAGIDNGQVLTMRGAGNAGIRGGHSGDLHIYVNVKSHKILSREGFDLNMKLYVPFYLLISGGEVEVPLTSGTTTIKIPELTQSNTVFKLKGKGIKHLQGSGQGNINVTIVGEAPKSANKSVKKLIDQLESELQANDFARYKSYLKDMQSVK